MNSFFISSPSEKKHALATHLCAWLAFMLILAQFLMAGLAMFHNGAVWKCHVAAGFLLLAPLVVLLTIAIRNRSSETWWIVVLTSGYFVQILLIVCARNGGPSILQALHSLNGALMLCVSLIVIFKTGAISIFSRRRELSHGW